MMLTCKSRGFFVTLEGGDGSGKSTQAALLASAIQKIGIKVCSTGEPGGSDVGNEIRKIIANPKIGACQHALIMLFMASRAQHIYEKINPELDNGLVVISDRYNDSTRAYQDDACDDSIMTIFKLIPDAPIPDITLLIDVEAENGLARARARSGDVADRFESEVREFHERVRTRYLQIAEAEQNRVTVVDGERDVNVVHNELVTHVLEKLAKSGRRIALTTDGFGKVVQNGNGYEVIKCDTE
jgi:dTMP kinase